jgi:uncharacterized protein YPO0396
MRLTRLTLFNWGTFSGLHEIPIAPQGFLFVGRSGSGKSTLLDAFTTLLIPPRWSSFNMAAREGERARADRNLVTYVRGAWADQSSAETGEIASQTLRPKTTWSALAAEYRNGLGKVVTPVQVLWIRGTSNATTDLRRHYLIAERPFDIRRELADFATDLDVRALKRGLDNCHHFSEYERYGERLRLHLGIESVMALKLLHKTQSAKNLGDLNAFLREFMLDPPRTFEVADRLVQEFAELDQAHQAVVTARKQIEVLAPAREAYRVHQETGIERLGLDRELANLEPYLRLRRQGLLEAELRQLATEDLALVGRESEQEAEVHREGETLSLLQARHRAEGGDRIEALERDLGEAGRERDKRLRYRDDAERLCRQLQWDPPANPESLAELVGRARTVVEGWQRAQARAEQERDGVRDQRREVAQGLAMAESELNALLRQPSNIPARMLTLRAEMAGALGLQEAALPFVGELIQVKPESTDWSGAIERVLHNFALSILVDERRYAAVSRYVNETHLGERLVYYRVTEDRPRGARRLGPLSMVAKLDLKPSPYRDWLYEELCSRFDYACVPSLAAFRDAERALTREGQVKHGRGRHEKDDRHHIDDRSRWVLGFDNREKLGLFRARVTELRQQESQLAQALADFAQRRDASSTQALACQQLMNLRWEEIDVATQLERIRAIETQLKELRDGNRDLAALGEQIRAIQRRLERAQQQLHDTRMRRQEIGETSTKHRRTLAGLEQDLAETPVEPAPREALDRRFAAERLSLANLDERARRIERQIREARERAMDRLNDLGKQVERQLGEFKRHWPMEAADFDDTLDSTPDYLSLLSRIERDGLPRFEDRFAVMLKEQSAENLAALSRHADEARKQIRERMDLVNQGLAEAEFNPGTHLRIEVSDRQLPEVAELRDQVRGVLEHVWTAELSPVEAEERFKVLAGIVRRLSSTEAEDLRWRERVLDVRLHVEFVGRELDGEGRELEVYRSGAGKSGGQREKLATTCLAAALRYQLGGREGGLPLFAPVVLDEAFGKADNEFTELAMRIFERFGFQMIVATPLKSVMTLEPFIGGACFVNIEDRKRSSTLKIEYDRTQRRLALPERAQGAAAPPAMAGVDG